MFTSVCESEAACKRHIFAGNVRTRIQSVKRPTVPESKRQRVSLPFFSQSAGVTSAR
jgi:hypothetical protein